MALFIGNLLDMFKYFISLPAIFGAAIWLGFLWRRVTRSAVIAQVFICFAIYAFIPNVFQSLEWARTKPGFLRETRAQTVTITTQAVREDVGAGRAARVGQVIRKEHTNPPQGIFYEKVALSDPKDPSSAKVGIGRFNAELWVLSWLGIDFAGFSKAQLSAVRFGFDAVFPFVLLFLLSAFTKPVPKAGPGPFLRQGPHAGPADGRGGGAGPAPRRRTLRGDRGPQAQARLELGDHEAEAHRPPRLRRLLAPRRRHHLPPLAHGEHPTKSGTQYHFPNYRGQTDDSLRGRTSTHCVIKSAIWY